MTIGERIKRIRLFRGLTLRELGIAIGLDAKTADVRMAQYESNYRVPKQELVQNIAQVLAANPINFSHDISEGAETIMEVFFWLEEDNPAAISLAHQFMMEWLSQKEALAAGQITKEQYFDWKINWPKPNDD